MMLSSASRQLRHVGRRVVSHRGFATASRHAASSTSSARASWMAAAAGVAAFSVTATVSFQQTSLEGPPPIEEKATGILFPYLEGPMQFVGCGVRVKYGFIKVYAVGTYADPMDMAALKPLSRDDRIKALLDPAVPRIIRIVMNRGLSIEKYTSAIVDALEPRMNAADPEALASFRALCTDPPEDLKEGDEIKMTIVGDTLTYRSAGGGGGIIKSLPLTLAMCDVYYGEDPVSPAHKEDVLSGIDKM